MFFPRSDKIPNHLKDIVENVFEKNEKSITSEKFGYSSDAVLSSLRKDLENIGYQVEKDKTSEGKIKIPVLFGLNGVLEKSFDADGYNENTKSVIEVEAGRGVTNYQFLKDLFQSCIMYDVEYLTIAVRNLYKRSNDFHKVVAFFKTLYTSQRLKLPLKGILIIGY
jgi:hypothetical protein